MKKLLIALFGAAVLTAAVTGCNTTRGAGEDLEDAGEQIQETVDDTLD